MTADTHLIPIAWSASFESGMPKLDEEHRVLATLYNDLVRALTRRTSLILRHEFFETVETAAAAHFGNEERLLRKLGGTDVLNHINSHSRFLDDIARLRLAAAEEHALHDAAHVLRRWLIEHFHEDQVLFKALRFQGKAPPD